MFILLYIFRPLNVLLLLILKFSKKELKMIMLSILSNPSSYRTGTYFFLCLMDLVQCAINFFAILTIQRATLTRRIVQTPSDRERQGEVTLPARSLRRPSGAARPLAATMFWPPGDVMITARPSGNITLVPDQRQTSWVGYSVMSGVEV